MIIMLRAVSSNIAVTEPATAAVSGG